MKVVRGDNTELASIVGYTGTGRWLVEHVGGGRELIAENRLSRLTAYETATLTAKKGGYGPEQATGPPDTPNAGDSTTAWAPASSSRAGDWLLVEYERPVRAGSIVVHETCAPGAIREIQILNDEGKTTTVWSNPKPKPLEVDRRELVAPLKTPTEIRFVVLRMACDQVSGWNEIDAIGLIDQTSNRTVWATRAAASSRYGSEVVDPMFAALPPDGFSTGEAP